MKSNLLLIFGFIGAIFAYAFNKGKNSEKNKENENVAKAVENRNRITKEVISLSDAALDSKLQKYKKPASK